MIGFTLALSELMGLLLSAVFWVAVGIAGQAMLGAGVLAAAFLAVRRWRRGHPH